MIATRSACAEADTPVVPLEEAVPAGSRGIPFGKNRSPCQIRPRRPRLRIDAIDHVAVTSVMADVSRRARRSPGQDQGRFIDLPARPAQGGTRAPSLPGRPNNGDNARHRPPHFTRGKPAQHL